MMAAETSLTEMMSTAERELGAFLLAVSEIAGADCVKKAGALWIQVLETADQIGDNPERVFRQTTKKALAELAIEADTWLLATN